MSPAIRNVLIVALLAALVAFVPGGGTAGGVLRQMLSLLFLGAIAWFAAVTYRQNRVTIMSLSGGNRLLLYGSIGLAALTATATSRLWHSGGLGVLVWFALIGAASVGVFSVYRSYQQY